jgi:hypothetical protein
MREEEVESGVQEGYFQARKVHQQEVQEQAEYQAPPPRSQYSVSVHFDFRLLAPNLNYSCQKGIWDFRFWNWGHGCYSALMMKSKNSKRAYSKEKTFDRDSSMNRGSNFGSNFSTLG